MEPKFAAALRALLVLLVALRIACPTAMARGQAAAASQSSNAPETIPQEMGFSLEGKITEHSSGKLTVSTEENIVFHVTYSDKTLIKRADGNAGSAKDLRTGVKIKVDGDLAESGEIAAKTIDIEGESPQSK